MTDKQTQGLFLCPFDPSVESNWRFHDEYEFWYIEFPEILKPDAKYKIDLARERGFKPWKEYKKYIPPQPPLDGSKARKALEDLKPFLDAKKVPFSDGAKVIWMHALTIRAALRREVDLERVKEILKCISNEYDDAPRSTKMADEALALLEGGRGG